MTQMQLVAMTPRILDEDEAFDPEEGATSCDDCGHFTGGGCGIVGHACPYEVIEADPSRTD